MAHYKLQMTKAERIDERHNLPVSVLENDYSKYNRSHESRSHGHLSNMLQRLFSVFNSNEKNTSNTIDSKNKVTQDNLEIKDDETQSLLDLEVCANAARETEACGQYEWIKSSDE